MVFQRDQPNALYGTAPAGARVTITLTCAGCPAPAATADASGAWRAVLPPLPATPTPFNVTVATPGAAAVVLADVLVGDVLLCSGQSNLALSLQMALNASAEIAALDAFGPTLRVFQAAVLSAAAPSAELEPPARAVVARGGARDE